MSVEVFSFRIARANVHPKDVKWMPFWLGEFAAFLHVDASKELVFDEPIVRTFLQCLRDKGVPAWKRLQAVRSIEWYLALVQRSIKLDLHDYKSKLTELAQRERCALSGETLTQCLVKDCQESSIHKSQSRFELYVAACDFAPSDFNRRSVCKLGTPLYSPCR